MSESQPRARSRRRSLGGRLVEAALAQEVPGRRAPRGAELLGVELRGEPVRLDQPVRWPALRDGAAPPSSYRSAMLDRSASRSTVSAKTGGRAHHERDDVAADPAAEAVEEPRAGATLNDGRLLVVERAQALEVAAAGVAQRDVLADDVLDRRRSRTSTTSSSRIRPATRRSYAGPAALAARPR